MITVAESIFAKAIQLVVKAMPEQPEYVAFYVKKHHIKIACSVNNFWMQALIELKTEIGKKDRFEFAADTKTISSMFNLTGSGALSMEMKGKSILFRKKTNTVKKNLTIESLPLPQETVLAGAEEKELNIDLINEAAKLHRIIGIAPLFDYNDPVAIIKVDKKAFILTGDNHHITQAKLPAEEISKSMEGIEIILPAVYMRYFSNLGEVQRASILKNGFLNLEGHANNIRFRLIAPFTQKEQRLLHFFESNCVVETARHFLISKELFALIEDEIMRPGVEEVKWHLEQRTMKITATGKGFELVSACNVDSNDSSSSKPISFKFHGSQMKEFLSIFNAIKTASKDLEMAINAFVHNSSVLFTAISGKRSFKMILSRVA